MIYDHLDRLSTYRPLSPRFAAAIDWLSQTDLQALTFHPPAEAGQHKQHIDGDDVFAQLLTYTPVGPEKVVWESHRDYADLQLVVSGIEQMGIAPLSLDPPVKKAYDATADAALYDLSGPDSPAPGSAFLPFSAGLFGIYLPQDLHAPSLAVPGQVGPVQKIVMKIRL